MNDDVKELGALYESIGNGGGDLLQEDGMLHPLGSGEYIDIDGETRISNRDRRIFQKTITTDYYNTLSELTEAVTIALNEVGIDAVLGSELWTGAFTGAAQREVTHGNTLDLVKDGKKVKNSSLILNIYRFASNDGRYELNAYLT